MTQKQAVLNLLSDRKPHTHHELYALGCVAHSRVSDLRADGHVINQWRLGDKYLYQLVGSLDEPDAVRDGSGSSSVPTPDTPGLPSSSTVHSPPAGEDPVGTLLLFECTVDESAGLRGGYWDDAA